MLSSAHLAAVQDGNTLRVPVSRCTLQQEVCRNRNNHSMFIFGMGYVGLTLARYLRNHGWDVSGTCANHEKKLALEKLGWKIYHFNFDDDAEDFLEESLDAMNHVSHMIVTIPPVADFDKDPVLSVYHETLSHMATCLSLHWIGYLSSTGVYGDYEGEWVDESSQPKPLEARALARLEAEKAWLKFGDDVRVAVQIFRLGGIYGPGRSAVNTILKSNMKSLKQLSRDTKQFISRIHVADICQAIIASIKSPCHGGIYNVVDDEPASRAEVFAYARCLIAEKWPSMAGDLELSIMTSDSKALEVENKKSLLGKRVVNRRMKEELGVDLLYPTYKSGLKSVIEELNM